MSQPVSTSTSKPSAPSQQKTKNVTGATSSSPKSQSKRNAKRARWAKKHVPRPVAPKRGPVKEYISGCCNLPAHKPQAGQKQTLQNADSGKMETTPKGLGHWRCTGCNKIAKVTPRKPEVKTEAPKESTDGI